jgi:hypothetical protein
MKLGDLCGLCGRVACGQRLSSRAIRVTMPSQTTRLKHPRWPGVSLPIRNVSRRQHLSMQRATRAANPLRAGAEMSTGRARHGRWPAPSVRDDVSSRARGRARHYDAPSQTVWCPGEIDRSRARAASTRDDPGGRCRTWPRGHPDPQPDRLTARKRESGSSRAGLLAPGFRGRRPVGPFLFRPPRLPVPASPRGQWHCATGVADHSGASAADSHGLVLLGPFTGHPRRP